MHLTLNGEYNLKFFKRFFIYHINHQMNTDDLMDRFLLKLNARYIRTEVPGELGLSSLTPSILIMVKPTLNDFIISSLHLNRLTEIF